MLNINLKNFIKGEEIIVAENKEDILKLLEEFENINLIEENEKKEISNITVTDTIYVTYDIFTGIVAMVKKAYHDFIDSNNDVLDFSNIRYIELNKIY